MKKLSFIFLVFLGLNFVEAALRSSNYPRRRQEDEGYSFSYNVVDEISGNDFGHEESRTGTDTSGEYHVLLPDGRVQIVKYNVDPSSGFQARVTYEGTAKPHPTKKKNTKDKVRPLASARPRPTILRPPKDFVVPVYSPKDYSPAPVSYPHRPVYNLIVPHRKKGHSKGSGGAHNVPLPIRLKKFRHKKEKEDKSKEETESKFDPYLKTEEELKGRDFSGPFFYPKERKISKEGTKKDGGKKHKKNKKHHL